MKCKNCYSNIPDESLFCKYCGAKLTEEIPVQAEIFQESDTEIEEYVDFPSESQTFSGKKSPLPVILAVFGGIFLLVFNLFFCTRMGFSGDIVKSKVNSVNIETVLDSEFQDGLSAVEFIYENMDDHFLSNTDAKLKDLRSFLVSSNIKGFATEKLSEYAEYFINGSDYEPTLSAHTVTNFIYSRRKLFTKEFDYEMDKTDFKELEESLCDEGFDEAVSVEGLSEAVGFNLRYAHWFFSLITIFLILLAAIGIFAGIFMLLEKNITAFCGYLGIPLISAGAVTAVPALIFLLYIVVSSDTSAIFYIISKLAVPFLAFAVCTGLFQAVSGTILILLKRHQKTMSARTVSDGE